ncbi:DUF6350 family protein [Nocardioides marmorisolisilvae]|uniref:Integral membrane protein n=1 Tax=Nocardioides marmorisolisilvae TaxID=1542737 RepID=A0A3N0DT17_9ACTN|nr:DUF6350 family protein [Nocardioides marmorisolisilvae]RNL78543.1 hypothetical protein EFL95_05470 [Nocardioides marmorisolisilvae]
MSDDVTIRLRREPAPRTPEPGRPLSATAAMGGAMAVGITLVLCMSLALTAWFLADGGAHGNTKDALRVGSDAWLMGHGSHLTLTGLPLGLTPLALTMMLVLVAFRCGRWAGRNAHTVTDDRVLVGGVATFAGAYVVIAVIVCTLATTTGATPGMSRTVLGALLISALAGGLGQGVGTGRLDFWLDQVPAWIREVALGAVCGALLLLASGAVLVAVSLLFSFNEASEILSKLDLSTGDALTYTLVMALVAPNLALLGSSYLLGPGFAIGTGTTVSPTAVSLGAVPAFPVLAALPGDGPTPGWLVVLMAVPALAAAIGAGIGRRDGESQPLDLAALRGAAAGFFAGVLITVAISFAGGPAGTGRMADIGAPTARVLVFATGTMMVGGLIGAVVHEWWSRRRRPAEVGAGPR